MTSLVKNAEDLAFLESMKGDRVASFGSFDKAVAQKISRRNVREMAAAERQKRARKDMEMSFSTVSSNDNVLSDTSDDDSVTEDTSISGSGRRQQCCSGACCCVCRC